MPSSLRQSAHWAAALAMLCLLSACRTLAPSGLPMSELPASWPERRASLQGWQRYGIEGRVAVQAGDEGFTAALRWAQADERSTLELQGPLGAGAVRMEFSPLQAPLETAAAREALEAQLGFSLPIESLRYWLLGVPDPGLSFEEFGLEAGGRLGSLQQGGWRIDYPRYALVAGSRVELPETIEIRRDPVRLRVRVARWEGNR
ncbi:MAG: outer membrane lipoprotein LolB [Sinobacteraceae bacterium]|nr:outer membrane lipoprotein LolB [Nevskiaceae bacterium]